MSGSDMNIGIGQVGQPNTPVKAQTTQQTEQKDMNKSIFAGDKDGDGRISRNDFSDARSWNMVLARGLAGMSWEGNESRVSDYTAQYEKPKTNTDTPAPTAPTEPQ